MLVFLIATAFGFFFLLFFPTGVLTLGVIEHLAGLYKSEKTLNSWLMVGRRQAWKTGETMQDVMMKRGMRKGDRMRALKMDDTMMVEKKDKRFVEFLKISWVGRRMDVKLPVFRFSLANFDPEKGSLYLLLLLINFVDLLVNCSV